MLSFLIRGVIQHFELYCPLSQVHAKSHCAGPGWRTPFLRKYLPSPFPSRKKISCTDECHQRHNNPLLCIILSVHVKQAVGIELHALGYLNPKVIVDDAIPVHINPSLGKFVGV